MIELKIDTETYQMPSTANDFTQEQLLFLANLCQKAISVEELKTKLFLCCIGGQIYTQTTKDKRHILCVQKHKYALTPTQFVVLTSVFDFLFDKINDAIVVKPQLTKQIFPTIQAGCKMLYGCDDAMTDFTYEQFIYMMEYASQGNTDAIIACMYLPVKGKFDAATVLKESLNTAKLSPNMRLIITWFYNSTMEFLSKRFPHCFSGGSSSKSNSFDTQNRIIDHLAHNDVTKKEIIRKSMLYDVLYTLELSTQNK